MMGRGTSLSLASSVSFLHVVAKIFPVVRVILSAPSEPISENARGIS